MKKTKVVPIFRNEELDPAYWVVIVFNDDKKNAFGPFENSGMAEAVKKTLDKIFQMEDQTVINYTKTVDSKLIDELIQCSLENNLS